MEDRDISIIGMKKASVMEVKLPDLRDIVTARPANRRMDGRERERKKEREKERERAGEEE